MSLNLSIVSLDASHFRVIARSAGHVSAWVLRFGRGIVTIGDRP